MEISTLRNRDSTLPDEVEFFEWVPDEILVMFIQTLDSKELAALSRTNKRWYNIIQSLIAPKYKKEIDQIVSDVYVKHNPKRRLEDVTPKMMTELGLLNNSLALVREGARKGFLLTPNDLFSLYDYMTDSKFEKKVKLLEELLKYFDLDEYYLIFLFEKIHSEMSRNSKEKTENLLKMADLLMAKGICISDKSYLTKFKVKSLKDVKNIGLRKLLIDKVQKAIC